MLAADVLCARIDRHEAKSEKNHRENAAPKTMRSQSQTAGVAKQFRQNKIPRHTTAAERPSAPIMEESARTKTDAEPWRSVFAEQAEAWSVFHWI